MGHGGLDSIQARSMQLLYEEMETQKKRKEDRATPTLFTRNLVN